MPSQPSPRPSPQRLHHLDALRSFAILYGLLVHAATIGVPAPLLLISDASGYFRMSAFFLVSGVLAAMLLERLGTGAFLRRRAVALLVPFAAGVVLLNPVTNWLIYAWHNEPVGFGTYLREALAGRLADAKGPGVWHLHLWFLVSLSAYAALSPALVGLGRRLGLGRAGTRLAALPAPLAVLAAAAGVAGATLALRVAFEATLDPLVAGLPGSPLYLWLVRITLYYAAFFALGLGLFHHAPLLDRLQAHPAAAGPAVAAGALAVWGAGRLGLGDAAGAAAALAAKAFLTTALVAGLLAAFRRWFARPGRLSGMAGSIYSIYVLHFLALYAAAFALAPLEASLGLPRAWLFVAVVAVAAGSVLALHHLVIAPSPVLSLLFNGKPLAAPAPARAGAQTQPASVSARQSPAPARAGALQSSPRSAPAAAPGARPEDAA